MIIESFQLDMEAGKYRAIIFDKDGTLCPPVISSKGKMHPPNDVQQQTFYPDVILTLEPYKQAGVQFAVCSNQGGVGWGIMKETAAEELMVHAVDYIGASLYNVCFTHPKARLPEYCVPDDPRRKPNPQMLLELMDTMAVRSEETLYVGDSPEDQLAALAAGCDFMLAMNFFKRDTPSEYRLQKLQRMF